MCELRQYGVNFSAAFDVLFQVRTNKQGIKAESEIESLMLRLLPFSQTKTNSVAFNPQANYTD
jgi:hypothetical protein